MRQRILNLMISFDQFFFSLITFGGADPDETMSAAAWRLEKNGKIAGRIFRPIIDTLFFFDDNHCKESYESEVERKQLHSEYMR